MHQRLMLAAALAVVALCAWDAPAAEPERIEVGLHLERLIDVPHKLANPDEGLEPGTFKVEWADPQIARGDVLNAQTVYVVGKKVGRTQLTVTLEGQPYRYDVHVVEKPAERRPELTLAVGETQFVALPKTLGRGPHRPFIGASNHLAVNVEFIDSLRIVISGVAPGISGLTIYDGKAEQYRVTVGAEPPAANAAKPALSLSLGEALVFTLPKPTPRKDGEEPGLPRIVVGGDGALECFPLAADQVLLAARRTATADLTLVMRDGKRQIVERRVRIASEPPLADSPRHHVLVVASGKTIDFALPEGFREKPTQTGPPVEDFDFGNPFRHKPVDPLMVLNSEVISTAVQGKTLRITGKQAGFTDIMVWSLENKLLALVRVRVK